MKFRDVCVWTILVCGFWLTASSQGADPLAPELATKTEGSPNLWFDIQHLTLEGGGWSDTLAPYDRLPGKAKETVPASVWGLSRHSTGYCVRFETDTTEIHARWTLTSDRLAMPHMAATGVSGLDLYVKTDKGWHWLATGQPRVFPTNTAKLVSGIPQGVREYLLYLPLYNGVSTVEIGIPPGNFLAPADEDPARLKKPMLFYGTSITQGGCASRTGMVHTAILGRRLNAPVINLGFSGSGRMEQALADLLAEQDPSIYILDCLPNMGPSEVAERVEPLVRTLRKAHPETPILLVEDRSYSDAFLVTSRRERNKGSRAELAKIFAKLKAEGVKNLFYLDGDTLLSPEEDDTVDGSHPTDLGFVNHANAFEKVLRPILRPDSVSK